MAGCTNGEHSSIRTKDGRTKLGRSGIGESDASAASGAPDAGSRVENFGVGAVFGVDSEDFAPGKKCPALFVIDVGLAGAEWRPDEALQGKSGGLRGAAVGLEVGAIIEDDALGIADRGPTGGVSHRFPRVGLGI